jgi:hypothetical protein
MPAGGDPAVFDDRVIFDRRGLLPYSEGGVVKGQQRPGRLRLVQDEAIGPSLTLSLSSYCPEKVANLPPAPAPSKCLPLVPHCGPARRYYNESDACGADWAAGRRGLGHPEAQADGVLRGKAMTVYQNGAASEVRRRGQYADVARLGNAR